MKNLVVITSIFDTIYSIYNYQERICQVEYSIISVRKNIPNSYIVLLEGGTAHTNDIIYFKNIVDEYITINIISLEKSIGEFTLLHTYFNMVTTQDKIIDFESISKLSGRYYFNNNFNFDKYKDKIVIKYRPDTNTLGVFETRYYKIPIKYFSIFLNKFNKLLYDNIFMTNNIDIEHSFVNNNIFLIQDGIQNELIGISGNIAPDGTLIED